MDISNISTSELKEILTRIPTELKRREKEEKTQVLKELEALAAKSGYSLNELLSGVTIPASKLHTIIPVKYRHPENLTLTWSGRGRKPKWVVEFIANGGTLESLLV